MVLGVVFLAPVAAVALPLLLPVLKPPPGPPKPPPGPNLVRAENFTPPISEGDRLIEGSDSNNRRGTLTGPRVY